MKALKILGGILLVIILAFFLIGVVKPTTSYQNTVTINRPAEVVWQVFTDAEKMDRWLAGMQSIDTLEGEPMAEGSRYRLIFNMEGEEIAITEEVTEVREPELFAFTLESQPLTSQVEIKFTALDSSTTRVDAHTLSEGNGLFWKPIITLSGSVMQQQSQVSYDKLKALVETGSDSLQETDQALQQSN